MRERIALVDGELDFDSRPGTGTTVTARIPVQRRPPEHATRTPVSQPHRCSA